MNGRGTGTRIRESSPLREERGMAMVATMLVMVLITGLASTALLRSKMDVAVAGNYKAQRAAEAVADGGVELTKAMIYGNEVLLNLPLSIPSTDAAARAWQAGGAEGVTYADGDIRLKLYIKYKQEDNINYNAAETYADEVVRYGQDYNYSGARRAVGRQPVYTLTVVDSRTGTRSETDLLAAMGFRTPAAIFTKGRVKMYKWGNAAQERIEVTSGTGTAALTTTLAQGSTNLFIQTATDLAYDNGSGTSYTATPNRANPTNHLDLFHNSSASPPWGTLTSCYTHFAYRDQAGGVGYYDRESQYYAATVYSTAQHSNHGATLPITPPTHRTSRTTSTPRRRTPTTITPGGATWRETTSSSCSASATRRPTSTARPVQRRPRRSSTSTRRTPRSSSTAT